MKTKTYILTLSTHFPKGHPREGEETEFAGKVLAARQIEMLPVFRPAKIHTIRANYDLWKHRVDEVNAGRAVLSVRQWLGAPRRSKQREIFRFDKDSGIGVEKVFMPDLNEFYKSCLVMEPDDGVLRQGIQIGIDEISANDGLTLEDWLAWFRDYDKSQPMAIIHFTNFRYCK